MDSLCEVRKSLKVPVVFLPEAAALLNPDLDFEKEPGTSSASGVTLPVQEITFVNCNATDNQRYIF